MSPLHKEMVWLDGEPKTPPIPSDVRNEKRKRLEAAGWKVGSVDEFLDLTPEESAMVAMRFNLAKALYEKRRGLRISQGAFAKRVKTTQPRIALAEKGADFSHWS